ncbi:helix-turn-helix transcriptional regulator [Saccharibacillus alkalitolerans]|uniref:Helix-turn-helix domain-containing protein n=1 Tax=Saccharibacillus alkalitolerans TaxID=2705290 RepID=A0ABX0FAD4_9BACL|nr:helix-turn-helix transcriptional regulator [Saccharibacillus alkalitolerans]NGZ76533.1 helix-turn-helix domain-containing protein [Saccharibacillus alkalitolerans]
MSDHTHRQELGRFLRTRRLRLSPEEAGLPPNDFTKRRTKGLRREEVAALAGISLPWYTSLEQGKDINVSDQVLDSLARVFRLNREERHHLRVLADPRRLALIPENNVPEVSSSLGFLLNQMPLCPAYISDSRMNVLAWNSLAFAVFGPFGTMDSRERNIIWRLFILPDYRAMFVDWQTLTAALLGHFRVMYSQHLEDPWYAEFIAEMTEKSPEFAAMWEDYEVRCASRHPQTLAHPEAGLLNLSNLVMPVQDGSGQFLHVYTPDSDDGSIERLERLALQTKEAR